MKSAVGASARFASRATASGEGDLAGSGRAIERFARLYRELLPPVYGYVRFRVGDPHVAEDLTEEVFERALAGLATVRDADRVRAWVFGIARHVVADARRREGSTPTTLSLETAEAAEKAEPSPEGDVLHREELRRVVAFVSELDERERDVIGLRFAAALRHRDIGRVLGLSEANVAQVLHRALVALRRRLQEGAKS